MLQSGSLGVVSPYQPLPAFLDGSEEERCVYSIGQRRERVLILLELEHPTVSHSSADHLVNENIHCFIPFEFSFLEWNI